MEESRKYTIHIIRVTRKVIQNTQTRIQNESNLTTIYINYTVKKWDHNENGNENSPQVAEK